MLLLLIATAAQAVATPPSAASVAQPSPAARPAAEKKVCQLEENVSSRIRQKKICLPQSEWDAIAKQTQTDLEASRNDRAIAPN